MNKTKSFQTTSNQIVSNREKLRNDIIHYEKLKNMKSHMRVSTPSTYSHIQKNTKKKYISDRKNDQILQENKILLKKMLSIDKNPQNLNPKNIPLKDVPSAGSLNRKVRQDEWVNIIKENKRILDKLGKVKTHQNIENQLQNQAQSEYLQQRIRENAWRNEFSKNKLGSFSKSFNGSFDVNAKDGGNGRDSKRNIHDEIDVQRRGDGQFEVNEAEEGHKEIHNPHNETI